MSAPRARTASRSSNPQNRADLAQTSAKANQPLETAETPTSAPNTLKLTPVAGGFSLAVLARPGASSDALAGVSEGALVVRISAPPVEGAANERLTRFLAKDVLKVPRSHVTLEAGERSRHKRLVILGLTESELREKLRGV